MKKSFYLPGLLLCWCLLSSVIMRAAVPVIVTNPDDTTVCPGFSASFTAHVTGAQSYAWQVSSNGGSSWTDLSDIGFYSGSSTDSLTVNADTSLNGNLYRLIATDTSGSDTSRIARLTVPPAFLSLITGPSAVCIGSSIIISDSSKGGTWSASNSNVSVASTGAVYGVSQGLDTITYSSSCTLATETKVIRIDTVINHGSISGINSVCVGSLTSLTESEPDGVWLSSNSGIANVDGSGNVTGVSQGSATISYYFSNACGASVATDNVTVYGNAGEIAGIDSVGVGNMRTLSDTTVGGTWSTSDSSVAVINSSGVVTGIHVGTDTILYKVTNLCGTSTKMITLHVGLPPSAGTIKGYDTAICVGQTITLTDSIAPGGVWSSSNNIAEINSSGSLTGIHKGICTISYVVTNAFGSSAKYLSVTVDSLPVIVVTPPTIGTLGGYVLTASPSGGTWTTTNDNVAYVFISSGISNLFVRQDGTDTVIYTATNICGVTQYSFYIDLEAAAVKSINNKNISLNVYPNPNAGDFTVNIQSNANEQSAITIINSVGEKVKEMTISTNTKVNLKLDQPAGIYFLNAVTPNGNCSAVINVAK